MTSLYTLYIKTFFYQFLVICKSSAKACLLAKVAAIRSDSPLGELIVNYVYLLAITEL